MTLDKETMKVSTALRIAKQYYPQDKLEHALRVATYVSENTFIPYDLRDECVALAIMHDLVEDTNFKSSSLPNNFQNVNQTIFRMMSIVRGLRSITQMIICVHIGLN